MSGKRNVEYYLPELESPNQARTARVNLCKDCRHSKNKSDGSNGRPIWWQVLCVHPKFERKKIQDPVTGAIEYLATGVDEKGDTKYSIDSKSSVFASDVNNGDCPYWER